MAISNTQLANQIGDLVDRWNLRESEMIDWLNGTVNGGPNLDGKYPITNAEGVTFLVTCPAQLEHDVEGNVSSALVYLNDTLAARDAAQAAQAASEAVETRISGQVDQSLIYKDNAAQSASEALEASVVATNAAADAVDAQTTVAQSEANALNSATDAAQSASAAQDAADAAALSETNAATSEANAAGSATSASASAQDASSSATSAASSASSAASSETNAAASASAAATSESNAADSATSASNSASAAATSESNAQAHATAAGNARDAAQLSATNAEASAQSASDSAAAAAQSAADAETAASSAMQYRGLWDASTGSYPNPANLSVGWLYKVATGGTVDGVSYTAGDAIIYNGGTVSASSGWDKIDNTDAVSSVAGKTGNVVLTKGDVGLGNVRNVDSYSRDESDSLLAGKLNSNSTAVAANKLATQRTISLSGDASGSVSFDGSQNVTLPVSISQADNADKVDGLQASQLVRADVDDVKYGYLLGEGFGQKTEGVLALSHPAGAHGSVSGSVTGVIKITLPVSWTATMLALTIRVYDYGTGRSFDLKVAGYTYTGGNWHNTNAFLLGDPEAGIDHTVRFGHDGSKCCICIGETNSVWSYPKVVVTEGIFGHGSVSVNDWHEGWAVSFETSLPSTVDHVHTKTNVSRYYLGNEVWHAGNFNPSSYLRSNADDLATGRITFKRDSSAMMFDGSLYLDGADGDFSGGDYTVITPIDGGGLFINTRGDATSLNGNLTVDKGSSYGALSVYRTGQSAAGVVDKALVDVVSGNGAARLVAMTDGAVVNELRLNKDGSASLGSGKTLYHTGNFDPSSKADASHSHAISEVTGLQTELDGKFDKTGGAISGDTEFNAPVLFRPANDRFHELDPKVAPYVGIQPGEFRPFDLYDYAADGPSDLAAGFEYLPRANHWHTQVVFDRYSDMYFRVAPYNATEWPEWNKVHHDGNSRQRIDTLWVGSTYTGSLTIAPGKKFSDYAAIVIISDENQNARSASYIPYDMWAVDAVFMAMSAYHQGFYGALVKRTSDTTVSVTMRGSSNYRLRGIYGVK